MKFKIIIIALVLATSGFFYVQAKNAQPLHAGHPPQAVTVYKTKTCGCCANYLSFLRTKNYDVTEVNLSQDNLIKKKRALGVPSSLDSCHTTVAGQYFIEGHIPYEAVSRLLKDKPNIKGIGMPGMPQASPGMPGTKVEPFAISQVNINGNVLPYLTL